MSRRNIHCSLLAAFLCHATLVEADRFVADEFIAIDAVERGMQGYGLTVFEGTEIDTFRFEVLGVERGSRPQQDIVWGIMAGGPLAETGAAAGMSGSPVYLDGKLLGAMAYGFSAAKKPYAGITPIGQMLETLALAGDSGPADIGTLGGGLQTWPLQAVDELEPPEALEALGDLDWLRDAARRKLPRRSVGVPGAAAIRLEPLATPLMVSGVDPGTFALMSPFLSDMGFMPLEAGGTSLSSAVSPQLEPGAMVGIQLIRGDWSMHGYGTVTYRQGDRIVAFGHPMFSTGQIEWPMITVDVHFIVANLLRSFKFGSAIETVGTVTQDRSSAIAGIVGPSPPMIAVAIDVDDRVLHADRDGHADRDPRVFHFEVVRDKVWTPAAVLFTVVGSIAAAGKMTGDYSIRLEAGIEVAGHRMVSAQNLFSGRGAPLMAGAAVSRVVRTLLDNRFETARFEKVDIRLTLEERNRQALIEGVRLARGAARPGDSIEVAVLLRPLQGDLERHTIELQIPESTPEGQLELRVSDARSAQMMERKRAPGTGNPRSLAQLLDALEATPGNNEITVDLLLRRPGVTVGSVELASVPGSMLSVMRSSRHAGETVLTQGTVLASRTLATEYVVSGQRQLPITVDRRAR